MKTVEMEIAMLEEQLRLAELGPDPEFFKQVLDDKLLIVAEDGHATLAKSKIVQAHQPGKIPTFTDVQMSGRTIIEHGDAAVVACDAKYSGPTGNVTLKFMRVWVRKESGWKIVAGSVSR
jgi:hypothetical protein